MTSCEVRWSHLKEIAQPWTKDEKERKKERKERKKERKKEQLKHVENRGSLCWNLIQVFILNIWDWDNLINGFSNNGSKISV